MSRACTIYPADRLALREVGLRDGLQMVSRFPGIQAKRDWIDREARAGVRHFEVGSFLPANRMPQFADLSDVIAHCHDQDLHSAALALNERGVADAVQTPVREIVNVVSATEAHSQANTRRTREAAMELVARTVQMADQGPERPLVHVGIAMSFGCSISGAVDPDEVLALACQAAERGADIVSVADTVGFAGPDQVAELTRRVCDALGDIPIGVHLHDTRGLGLANAAAALDAGARILDGALGGLGGCPFAPGATGNVVFEDLVFLAERKGFDTGIDLEGLKSARAIAEAEMPQETFHGALHHAGPPPLMPWRAMA